MKRLSNKMNPLVIAFLAASACSATSASSAVPQKKRAKPAPIQIVSLSVTPARPNLQGPYGEVRILVDGTTSAGNLIDVSARATYKIADPTVASLDESGILHAKFDGKTLINITVGKLTAKIPVE